MKNWLVKANGMNIGHQTTTTGKENRNTVPVPNIYDYYKTLSLHEEIKGLNGK